MSVTQESHCLSLYPVNVHLISIVIMGVIQMKQYKMLEKSIQKLTLPPKPDKIEYIAVWGNEAKEGDTFIAEWGKDT